MHGGDSGNEPSEFSELEQRITKELQAKLRLAGLNEVTVSVYIPEVGDAGMHLSGPKELVRAARKLLEGWS